MDLTIKYDDIENFAKENDKNTELLINYIKTLSEVAQKLNTCWSDGQTIDYQNKLNDYIKKLESVPTIYGELSKAIRSACIKYNDCDTKYASEIKKVVDLNG